MSRITQNDRFGKGKDSNMHRASAQAGQIRRRDQSGNEYITPGKKQADWVKMQSVTEQGSLDEFLSTAELAGTDFTAEKLNNVKIIHTDQKNPYLLSAAEERGVVKKQNAKRARLTVPRRPPWDEHTTPNELDERERASLLEWRRGLAELQEVDDLLMTPFERNLEVWRQLWRVIERSDLVVQIVDARNPLLFRCEDLEVYVKEVDRQKRNLLLVNKADMMTLGQRIAWAKYFETKGINFRFFSAELAKEMNEARQEENGGKINAFGDLDVEGHEEDDDENEEDEPKLADSDEETDLEDNRLAEKASKIILEDQREESKRSADDEEFNGGREVHWNDSALNIEELTRILTTEDLESLFIQHSPPVSGSPDANTVGAANRKTQIGLVGYPNVGKSSTINALLGAKKVSVSATPGKTKHFQTIHLSDKVILCDCPGLVFPNFATTKAELVCNGVLPIDQLREYTGPATLVAQRIPLAFLESVYGMKVQMRPIEEGGTGEPTGEEILRGYARARGFFTQGLGQPDESRAARYILKDYVKGKLLFCHPPPQEPPIDAKAFNRELYDPAYLTQKHHTHLPIFADSLADIENPNLLGDNGAFPLPAAQGSKGKRLDKAFFGPGKADGGMIRPFHYKYSEQGKQLTGRKLKTMTALEKGLDPAEVNSNGKKHFKGNKRQKERSKAGAGDYD